MDALGETSDEANVVESVAVDHPAAIPDEVAREQHREGEYLNILRGRARGRPQSLRVDEQHGQAIFQLQRSPPNLSTETCRGTGLTRGP